ncbi:uncharacterized protein METZ01_LOCUS449656, partial [marine metagenome]
TVDSTNLGVNFAVDDNITITFSEAMDPDTITTNTGDTQCSGNILVSKDNFATNGCVRMSSDDPETSNNKTFTLDPFNNLSLKESYKLRITTDVKDPSGNNLESTYETTFSTPDD